jgi:hypothetical protein
MLNFTLYYTFTDQYLWGNKRKHRQRILVYNFEDFPLFSYKFSLGTDKQTI